MNSEWILLKELMTFMRFVVCLQIHLPASLVHFSNFSLIVSLARECICKQTTHIHSLTLNYYKKRPDPNKLVMHQVLIHLIFFCLSDDIVYI